MYLFSINKKHLHKTGTGISQKIEQCVYSKTASHSTENSNLRKKNGMIKFSAEGFVECQFDESYCSSYYKDIRL